MQDVRQWFETPLGERVLETEEKVLEQLLPGYFGYHLLQLSVQEKPLFNSSVIRHKFNLVDSPASGCGFVGDCEQLPFEEDSLDVVVLHHMLDFHRHPQKLLREVGRVSLPQGQLVIIGFNPISLWGLWKPIAGLRQKAPWHGKYIYPGRLMDWLNLLNFKIDRAHYCLYGPPAPRYAKTPDYQHGLSRNANWPFGAVYVIVARKQVGSMIPMKPFWKPSRALGRLSVVPPARPAAGRGLSTRDLPPGE